MKKIINSLLAAVVVAAGGSATAGVITTDPITLTVNADHAADFALGKSYTGNIVVDFRLRYEGTLANNTYTGLFFDANHFNPSLGLKANCGTGGCSNDVYARIHGTSGAFAAGSDLQAGTNYHIVGHLQKTNGSATYNQFDVWVFDSLHATDLDSLGQAHASFVAAEGTVESFHTVGLRTFNLMGNTVVVDDIRLNEVPEPGSLALIGLALAGVGAAARRRKQQ